MNAGNGGRLAQGVLKYIDSACTNANCCRLTLPQKLHHQNHQVWQGQFSAFHRSCTKLVSLWQWHTELENKKESSRSGFCKALSLWCRLTEDLFVLQIIDIPNSMTVLPELLPISVEMVSTICFCSCLHLFFLGFMAASRIQVGILNCPGHCGRRIQRILQGFTLCEIFVWK